MSVQDIASDIVDCFKRGNKILICGSGGSASQSQHMAAELMGRFEKDRAPLPAIALTTDTSFITAWSNDYDFRGIFQRQLEGLGKPEDILITFSTSGKSKNILGAIIQAKRMGIKVIDFPRKGKTPAEIQEYQLHAMHSVVREVERKLFP
jgi:D-sedoheptulose 7-phosphate isomerase